MGKDVVRRTGEPDATGPEPPSTATVYPNPVMRPHREKSIGSESDTGAPLIFVRTMPTSPPVARHALDWIAFAVPDQGVTSELLRTTAVVGDAICGGGNIVPLFRKRV
jgi:hypothetical protein